MFRQRMISSTVGACSPATEMVRPTMSTAGGLIVSGMRSLHSSSLGHHKTAISAVTSLSHLPGGCRAFSSGRTTDVYGNGQHNSRGEEQQQEVQRSELHMAALNGNLHRVIEQVTQVGIDPNQMDSIGYTSLHLAAGNGHLDIVNWLLEGGITDVNAGYPEGSTPLHLACMYGHTEAVKVLLKNYALLDAEDDLGYLPLHRAAFSGNVETVNVLLGEEHLLSLDIDAASAGSNATALHIAASGGHESVVEALLDTGFASATVQDMEGKTPREACNNAFAESSSIRNMLQTAEEQSEQRAAQREAKSGTSDGSAGGAGAQVGAEIPILIAVIMYVMFASGGEDEEKKNENEGGIEGGLEGSEPLDAFVSWWTQLTVEDSSSVSR